MAESKRNSWYAEHREEEAARKRSWYAEHREEEAERKHKHYQEHKEQYQEKNRKYYLANREKILEKRRENYVPGKVKVDPEKLREINRRYQETHKDEIREKKKIYREAHKDEINERNRQYKAEHREELLEYGKQYREAHRDEINARRKQYAETHKERVSEINRKYREEHRDEINERKRQYRAEHKEEIRAYDKQRWRMKRYEKYGNEKLVALRGEQSLKFMAAGVGMNPAKIKAAEQGKRILSQREQKRLAYYYGVEIEELGFDDAPKKLKEEAAANLPKVQEKTREKSKATQQRDERIENMPTMKGAAYILPDTLGKRFTLALGDIRKGAKPKDLWQKYRVDLETYAVLYKMVYGGLTSGKHGPGNSEEV